MKIVEIAKIRDYRAGVSMDLYGVAKADQHYWEINYTGEYGFEGDPAAHFEQQFSLDTAMKRWGQLVKDYRDRVLGLNRLKAFKKDWVPPFSKNRRSQNDEAMIWDRGGFLATMTSQGPKSRRLRIWNIQLSVEVGDLKDFVNKLLIPRSVAKPPLEEYAEAVPISRMSERLNELWAQLAKHYKDGM